MDNRAHDFVFELLNFRVNDPVHLGKVRVEPVTELAE